MKFSLLAIKAFLLTTSIINDAVLGNTLPQCVNVENYDAGWGTCETYAEGKPNHAYCYEDKDANGIYAKDACSECLECKDKEELSPSFSPSSSPSSTPVASPPSTVQIKNAASGNWCLTVKGAFNGAKTLIKKCSNTNALQKFVISNDTGLIRLKMNSAKCIKKVKNTMKVQPCAVTDPFKWTIQPYNGPFYWTKANLNQNVAVAGDTLGGGRGIVLATFNDNANSHKWRTVAI